MINPLDVLNGRVSYPQTEPESEGAVSRFAGAIKGWVKAGAPKAPIAARKLRKEICLACEHWQAAPIPKCKVCGCTGLKRWMATERCPLGKWPAIDLQGK